MLLTDIDNAEAFAADNDDDDAAGAVKWSGQRSVMVLTRMAAMYIQLKHEMKLIN